MQINKRQFKKWIAALDSGKYNQGHCALQNRDGYCCLGVGCKVTISEKHLLIDAADRIAGGMPSGQPMSPNWLIHIDDHFYHKTGKHLVDLNDDLNFTFPEIATLLELVYIHKMLD